MAFIIVYSSISSTLPMHQILTRSDVFLALLHLESIEKSGPIILKRSFRINFWNLINSLLCCAGFLSLLRCHYVPSNFIFKRTIDVGDWNSFRFCWVVSHKFVEYEYFIDWPFFYSILNMKYQLTVQHNSCFVQKFVRINYKICKNSSKRMAIQPVNQKFDKQNIEYKPLRKNEYVPLKNQHEFYQSTITSFD